MSFIRAFLEQKIGIGTRTPTALLHIAPGAAAVESAPLKLTSGLLLSVPEDGALEFYDTLYFTVGGVRVSLTAGGSGVTSATLAARVAARV